MMTAKIHVAPMMGWTDRHFRRLLRMVCPSALLYTEMITTGSLLQGGRWRLMDFDKAENPVVVQFGGSDPQALRVCAEKAQEYGYGGVNLNVGCPSPRVQAGNIGACLYKQADLVVSCVEAMVPAQLPVSVKLRIGVDDCDDFAYLVDIVSRIRDSGASCVQVHARKAWLKGLNPRQNRSVPPLDYHCVENLMQAVGDFPIILNGGIATIESCKAHLRVFPGVMIGRKACESPWFLRELHEELTVNEGEQLMTQLEVVQSYLVYAWQQLQEGGRATQVLRPLLTFLKGRHSAKKCRLKIMEQCQQAGQVSLASFDAMRAELISLMQKNDEVKL